MARISMSQAIMASTSNWCCMNKKSKVSPEESSMVATAKVQTIRGVTQERIVLSTVLKMPSPIQTLVLGEFNGYMHIPSPRLGIPLIFLGGLMLIILGIYAIYAAMDVREVRARYDNLPDPASGQTDVVSAEEANLLLQAYNGTGFWVDLTLEVKDTMRAPVYLFYYIYGFYGAHRRYVRSRSNKMLAGASTVPDEKCRPKLYANAKGEPDQDQENDGLINPCGLLAWSLFNDTFELYNEGTDERIELNQTDLAWEDDAKYLYANSSAVNFNSDEQWWMRGGRGIDGPINQDDHFMLWMRVTGKPDVYHPWARIDRDLVAGTQLKLRVLNRYNTYGWSGEKGVVLTTNTWIGGRNVFLGSYLLVLGSAYILGCVTLFATFVLRPKKAAIAELELSWQRKSK